MIEIGLDVGSMTVKAVVFEAGKKDIIWKDYTRHNGRQAETLLDMLTRIMEWSRQARPPQSPDGREPDDGQYPSGGRACRDHTLCRIAITGSGGRSLKDLLGARFIQEVNAVTLAVETLIPDARSVMELGGQDAKMIIWKGNGNTVTYMNDKCAGGTGSTIDKISAKLAFSPEEAAEISPKGRQIHRIAAKCGVFAETDVVGLLKAGIPREDIFISLMSAVVSQNLEVLAHGNVLPEKVVLLGGPNTYIKSLPEIWRKQIKEAWELHGYTPRIPPTQPPPKGEEQLVPVTPLPSGGVGGGVAGDVIVPPDSQYFAAIGSVIFAREEGWETEGSILDLAPLKRWIDTSESGFSDTGFDADDETLAKLPSKLRSDAGGVESILPPLIQDAAELAAFKAQYALPDWQQPIFPKGSTVECYLGVDGGSTSTKLALIDANGTLLYRDYVLSQGNPLSDAALLFTAMKKWQDEGQFTVKILGSAATGYAQDILKAGLGLDKAVVETVAHMRSATALYGDVDVICDVGGQDIKALFLKNKRVVDFKLNTQCSAGNGFFLQSMANQFGIPVEEYADYAFRAKRAPKFNYGCAVFMEQDRVNFQQAGWSKEEMMCGLAQVLPYNIWNYVVQESNIANLGKKFVLQGGTQKNLAAVKAQVDYIKRKAPGAEVFVHKYADLGGAIGAAMEVINHEPHERHEQHSAFIGIEAASNLTFESRNDETTRCSGCGNQCRRTFVDIKRPKEPPTQPPPQGGRSNISQPPLQGEGSNNSPDANSPLPLREGVGGGVAQEVTRFISGYQCERGASEVAASALPKSSEPDISMQAALWAVKGSTAPISDAARQKRSGIMIGMPSLLNMFYYGPFFRAYFEALGANVIFSSFTSDKLWSEGNKWGAIDPCFPAKAAPAHIWQLLNKLKKKDAENTKSAIFFPILTHLETFLKPTLGNAACVIQMGTPEVVAAVFSRDRNYFDEYAVDYWHPSLKMDRSVEARDGLFEYLEKPLALTVEENDAAFAAGEAAMQEFINKQQSVFIETMNRLIDENRVGLLLIGHPYHNDPGLNHGIPAEFQRRGFPVFTIDSLPTDAAFLNPLFKGGLAEAMNIQDVWMRNFNRNTNHKIWAARVAGRHPNLAVIDLSSFKCGHDAPTYYYVSQILDASETPHFTFHDIDQNKPGATFKLRIDTIDYFLREYEAAL